MAQPIPITNFLDLTRLYTAKRQRRDPAVSDLRPVYALDTETYGGDIFLIADSEGRYLDKDVKSNTVIDFLFAKKYQGAWNFFWNIGYDGAVILKLLGKELMSYTKTRRLVFYHNGRKIVYIPGKCLRIKDGHHSSVFFDAAQYFRGTLPEGVPHTLANVYQANFGTLDPFYLDLKGKRDEFSPRFYRRNTTAVRRYCVNDCMMTKRLAEKWIDLYHQASGFYLAKWYSAGYLAEKFLINNDVAFPTFASIPYAVQELAWRSYVGGRFELLRRGFIGRANLYDINSAYPHKIANLPDLSDGQWISTKTFHPEAQLGFFEIEANIPDTKRVAPFPFHVPGSVLFPSGRFRTYVTLDELRACESEDYYRVLGAWQYIPNSDHKPYKDFIESLYSKRLALKRAGDPLQLPLKIIMNSIYGKTGQKIYGVIGNLFNPVIFASITGGTRAQMYRFVIDNGLEDDVISFATDSICTTCDLGIKSNRLGDFSLDKSGNDAYYLQNGIYRINGKWKRRGIGSIGGKTMEHVDTIEKDGRLYLVLTPTRSASLRECIIQGRIKDIGKIRPVRRLVNLNADRKRLWMGTLKSVDDKLYNDSSSLSLNHIAKEEI